MKAKVSVLVKKYVEIPDLPAGLVETLIQSGQGIDAGFYQMHHRSTTMEWAELRLTVFKVSEGSWPPSHDCPDELPYPYFTLESADDIGVFAEWVDCQKKLYPNLVIEDNRDDIQYDE